MKQYPSINIIFDSMDFDPFKRKISELHTHRAEKGNVLVAEPFMQDPYFKRSVVLLTEHNEEGTVGFILNHLLQVRLAELIPELSHLDLAVYLGGPVQSQSLFYIHRNPDIEGSIQLQENLYWDGNFEQIKALLVEGSLKESDIRLFLGYSGWETNQLEDEIKAQSWLIGNVPSDQIFKMKEDKLWKVTMQAMGKQQSYLAEFPEDPELN